jgi:hypothetical protein
MNDVRALQRKLTSVADLVALLERRPGVAEDIGCVVIDALQAQVTRRFPAVSALEQSILALMVVKMVVRVLEESVDVASQKDEPHG